MERLSTVKHLLAGDIGGTKTHLGLFASGASRPSPRIVREYTTLAFGDLPAMVRTFLEETGTGASSIDAACFGVAGPVLGDTAALTNVPWRVDRTNVGTAVGIAHVGLLNDLYAMALAVPALDPAELRTLQAGQPVPGANMALLAAGTGLGEGLLHAMNGHFVPSPSEGGNADFAARTEREIVMLRYLTRQFGRARVEHVLSGPGFVNIHRAIHERCEAGIDLDSPEAPAAISAAALERACQHCEATLDLFVEALGAEAGNHALRSMATAGVFIGGGIARKILPALERGGFIRAFLAKAPLESMVARIPVHVIMNAQAGLLGAAIGAAALVHG
jgi:glucokinase